MNKIKYRPHQIIPINYLIKKENRGLIINHYMGSGKTLLGLGFANKMKHKDIIMATAQEDNIDRPELDSKSTWRQIKAMMWR